jgi:type IV pilus assembly protein PilE
MAGLGRSMIGFDGSRDLTSASRRPGGTMRARGFTLIELMMVVVIIGLLSAIAAMNFNRLTCRAKQSEAKTVLKAIVIAEEDYRTEYDRYVASSDTVTWAEIYDGLIKGKQRYTYTAIATGGASFLVTADGNLGTEVVDDIITVNQVNNVTIVTTSCD